jgi:hypothetical protein
VLLALARGGGLGGLLRYCAQRDSEPSWPRGFAASLSGLKGATTYYFRAVLFNAATTITGTLCTIVMTGVFAPDPHPAQQ